jgi:myosin-5
MPPAHPYIKGTRVWLPDPQQAWSAGEITAVDNPSNVDTAESDDVYITLHIKQEQNPDVEIVQSFPLSVLVAAGQNQLVPTNAAATSPATTTTTTATPGVGSGAGSLVGKDDDGKPVILPPLRNPPLLEQTDDLSNLSNLNEPSVLHAISTRYDMHLPYTYSGIVLVALNPFSPLNIYGQDMINQYAGKKKGELEPHLFAIAEEALDYMRRGNGTGGKDNTGAGDQTIIVSGERYVFV